MRESSSPSPSHGYLTLADIVGVYGIKGWVRLRVHLDDPNLLLSFPDLTLVDASDTPERARQSVVVEALQIQGKGHIARLSGIADRTAAEALRGREIQVAASDFPAAGDDRCGAGDGTYGSPASRRKRRRQRKTNKKRKKMEVDDGSGPGEPSCKVIPPAGLLSSPGPGSVIVAATARRSLRRS